MFLSSLQARRVLPKVILSLAVSVGLLALLIRFTLSSADISLWSSLVDILLNYSLFYILVYVIASLLRTYLQARRYQVLLEAVEDAVPSFFHLYLVTLSRNMFVDMLPARLGELSYIAMLNKGYRVSAQACVSSLAISFVFDLIALGVLILFLIVIQVFTGSLETWMVGTLIVLSFIIMVIVVLLYRVLGYVNRLFGRLSWMQTGLLGKGRELLVNIEQALEDTRRHGSTKRVMLLSLGIRLVKYLGLYCLFAGVVIAHFPEMTTRIARVLPALVSAEAGASLPIPAFMGFGTYEAAGTLALVALGASKAASLIVMLSMHILSQFVDYLLGGLGVVLFIFKTDGKKAATTVFSPRNPWKMWTAGLLILAFALVFLAWEMRAVKKRGAVKPPEQGRAVSVSTTNRPALLAEMDGFLVWSSNRSGNHDIYLYSLSDGVIRQMTTHPHTEYYPRISPDGRRIVFARSHQPWVSQRNIYPWDVIMLDLKSGKETVLAKNGNLPTWSADGRQVYFQRHGNEVVAVKIKNGEERIVYKAGVSVKVPPKTALETPSISERGERLAVTLRNTMRGTAVVERDGSVRPVGKGCQLSWGPGDGYLYKIDHGGKMENALYRIDPTTLEATKWFDAPGDYSHEYFPRVANTADVLVYGASAGGHEHDTADYEIFLWKIGTSAESVARITFHTGNDCWPDIFLRRPLQN